MIEWEPNKNDVNLNMPVDGQVASICWNEQTKLLTMSLAYSAVYGMGERYNGLNQNDRIVKIEVEEKFCNQGDKSYCPSPFFFTDTGFSFCTLSGGTLIFDFTQKNVITVHAPGNCKFIFNAGTPEKLISEYMPNCKIILLTMYTELLKIKTIIKTINPSGLVIKNDLTFDELLFAFNKVITGEKYYSESVLKMLSQSEGNSIEIDQFDEQILFHISKGTKLNEMPQYIPISVGAIERRKLNLKESLDIKEGSDTDLVYEAKNKGLLF